MKTKKQQKRSKKVWSRPEIVGLSVRMTSTGRGNGDECFNIHKNTFVTCSGA